MLNKFKSLRMKVLFISVCFLGLFSVIHIFIEYLIIYPSFILLEREEAQKNLSRAVETIRNSMSNLRNTCRDWATWDDAYEFIQTGADHFITANLVKNTFENNKIHLLFFFNDKGYLTWGELYSERMETLSFPTELRDRQLPPSHPFFSYDTQKETLSQAGITGIWMTEFGPILIAALPILTSESQGPVAGTLVMGRLLSNTLVQSFSAQAHARFEILPYDSEKIPAEAQPYQEPTPDIPHVRIFSRDETQLSAYTTLSDIYGREALIVKADTQRDISAKGQTAVRYAIVSNFIGAIGIVLILILLLQQTVLNPITRLKNYILGIGKSGNISPPLELNLKDEIGTLGMEFDKLLIQLDGKTAELVRLNIQLSQDIEKRKLTEQALLASEERFRSYVENASDIIYTMNAEGVYTYITPNVEALFGYKNTELIGKSYKDIWHPEDVEKRVAYMGKVLKGEKAEPPSHRVFDKEGNCVWFTTSLSTFKNRDGAVEFLGIARNIDAQQLIIKEKEALQERLARSQKMEALGLLAGGVAHDLNNVLSGIASYPELLLLDMPLKSRFRKPLQTIQQSGQKAAEIVQDLLTLARRGVMNKQVLCLNTLITDYLNSPEYEKLVCFHPGMMLKTSLAGDLLNIHGGPIHLRKTVMNLVSNAAEAQPEGGEITVSTWNEYLDKPVRGYETIAPGDYVILKVSDSGIGIRKEDIARIFEPFYTKKVMGRSGTGLGMAVVWGTVQDHNGYIDIDSIEGKGTSFSLYFPATQERIFSSADTFRIEDYKGMGKTVLVIDDMEDQRLIASEILKKAGYAVTAVQNGEEAVRYLSKNAVDLLVLDMIMDPGMDGLTTYQKIRELHPGQRAIIASGYSETDRVKETLRLGASLYIRKPYTIEKILKAANTALTEIIPDESA